MRLFYYPHAPYSRKVLVAAHEKEITFERELCPPFAHEAKAKLKSLHPLATVPLLVDGAHIHTESSIIVEAFDLASKRGARLVPPDARAALEVRALDRFSDAHLVAPTAYLAWATRKPSGSTLNHEKIGKQRASLEIALGLLDARLANRAFVAGAELTMADLSPTAAIASLLVDKTVADLAAWPNVQRWYDAMRARPSVRAVEEECLRVPLPSGF